MSLQVKFVTLPRAQLGLIADVIINLESSTTKKELQANKQKIFTYLRFTKPKELEGFVAADLKRVERRLEVDSGDVFFWFWYEKEEDNARS